MAAVLGIIGLLIPALILGGVYAESVNSFLRTRVPQLCFEDSILLVWGSLVLGAFTLGLVAMYILMYP